MGYRNASAPGSNEIHNADHGIEFASGTEIEQSGAAQGFKKLYRNDLLTRFDVKIANLSLFTAEPPTLMRRSKRKALSLADLQ
jgi:hypothetical protein